MKKIYTFFIAVSMTAICSAQAPQKISYQAVIRNANDQLVTNHTIGMRISILQSSATGTPVYVETQTPTINANGLATIEIGGGTPVTGTFVGIDWSTGVYFIKTETDPIGGTSYTITGTSQLLSVPYALYAKTADNVDGMKQQIKTLEDNLIAAGTYKLSDIEGNQYNVVKIGSQVWMKENLKTVKYNDGTGIPLITDGGIWTGLLTPGYCWYNNDAATYKATYGALYNWFCVSTGKLCPSGWHVPTDAEWTTLTTYLGGADVAGGKLKEVGTTHWASPNTGATNEIGFSALPCGNRWGNGPFVGINTLCYWWSSTEVSTLSAWYRQIYYDSEIVDRPNFNPVERSGFSVRCLRDN